MKYIFLFILISFASCTNNLEEQATDLDINALIKCISEISPLVPDVMEIIDLIKKGDWIQVLNKAVELVSKGIPAVKDCISAFKEEFENGKSFRRLLKEGNSYQERLENCAKKCVKLLSNFRLTCMNICMGGRY